MECLTNILWAPMSDLTVSDIMAGLTNILWAPMAGPTFSCGRRMAVPTEDSPLSVGAKCLAPPSHVGANGWPHGGFPIPINLSSRMWAPND